MQNVLHVISQILNNNLGSRTRFQSLVEQSRFSHRVLSTSWTGSSNQTYRREYGPNWEIDALWGQSLLATRGAFYLTWPSLRAQIWLAANQCKAQIIQGHNPTLISLAAADLAGWLHLPFVFETHGLTGTETQAGENGTHKGRQIERRLVQQASRVIVQTRAMKNSLVDLYGRSQEKVVVLPNFVDAERCTPQRWQQEGRLLRQKWGAAPDEKVFLYPGFVNWYNGIPELLAAFAAARFERPARLVVCGDGDLVDKVREAEKTSPNPVRYIGTVDHGQMPAVYAASDCLVLARPDVSETREATPMKLLEAMVMEKVVLCSRVAGMTELANDHTAVLVRPGNVADLRQSLEFISHDFASYTHLGINARVEVIHKFTAAAVGQKLDRMYLELGCQL